MRLADWKISDWMREREEERGGNYCAHLLAADGH